MIDRTVETPALIDSGAGGMFIDEQFARDNNIALTPLINRIPVYNVDGTQNKQGVITHYAWRELSVAGITRRTRLLATSLGKEAIILGLPWLRRTNAKIDWQTGKVEFEGSSEAESPKPRPRATVEDEPEPINQTISHLDPSLDHCLEEVNACAAQFAEPDTNEHHCPSPREEPIDLDPDDLLVAYVRGEPVIGIFSNEEEPLTEEHLDEGEGSPHIGRIMHWKHSAAFSYAQGR